MSIPASAKNVPLARRQLLAKSGRAMAGVGGIAVALLLVLALQAIFAGMEGRLTVYIDRSGADVIVAQQGVQTMHMTQSAVPAGAAAVIGRVPGVASSRLSIKMTPWRLKFSTTARLCTISLRT